MSQNHPIVLESPTLESRGLLQATEPAHLPARSLPESRHARLFRDDPYRAMVRELKSRYKISVRKWQSRMSGGAYELKYRDGRIKRLITAPRPRSPVSAAIFLHEVGHHAIGFHRYPLRCLEEHYVWQWTFREMKSRHIPLDGRVVRHYQRSMSHYIRMAQLQGHCIPEELRSQIPLPV